MALDSRDSSRRPVVLAAAMVAVLAASVAVAAWLSQMRGAPRRAGDAVLEHLRTRGLAAFWGRQTETLWYLLRDARGRAVGWWRLRRSPIEGGYQGHVVRRSAGSFDEEQWSLGERATEGQYQADEYALVQRPGLAVPLRQHQVTTRISLARGQVVVARTPARRRGIRASDTAPEHYVPEGVTTLVLSLAAAGGKPAVFALVFNEFGLSASGVQFAEATVEPQGPRRARITYSLVLEDLGKKVGWAEVLEFDAGGNVLRGTRPDSGITWEQASFEDVRGQFPEAARYAEPPDADSPTTREETDN